MRFPPALPSSSVLAVLLCLGGASPSFASPVENEVAGGPGKIALSYGDHTAGSALVTRTETDNYTFEGQAGDRARIQLHTRTGGLDASLTLRGPTTGSILQSTWCNGGLGATCSTSLEVVLPETGLFTINVNDVSSDETGDYELHLQKLNHPDVLDYRYISPVAGALGHTTDIDLYAFQGLANSIVGLSAITATGGLDLRLEVWDPAGNRISDSWCNGGLGSICSTAATVSLGATGVYTVGVSDVSSDEPGNYELGVNCVFGDCPAPYPIAAVLSVPEPQTYALFLAGIGLMSLAVRFSRQRNRA